MPACVMQAGKAGTHILWPRPNRGSSKCTGSCRAIGEAAGLGTEGCIPANRCSAVQYPGQHAQPAGPQAASELPAVRHLYQAAASSCSSAQVSLLQHSIILDSSHHHGLLLARCCFQRVGHTFSALVQCLLSRWPVRRCFLQAKFRVTGCIHSGCVHCKTTA